MHDKKNIPIKVSGYLSVCLSVYLPVCLSVYMSTCLYVCLLAIAAFHTYTYACTHIHTYTHVHTHTANEPCACMMYVNIFPRLIKAQVRQKNTDNKFYPQNIMLINARERISFFFFLFRFFFQLISLL